MTRDGPLWLMILAVGTGAGLGAVCRWMLSYFLNPLAGWMPWGTLASNAAGAFIRAGVHMASHLLLSLTGTWAGWTAVRSL